MVRQSLSKENAVASTVRQTFFYNSDHDIIVKYLFEYDSMIFDRYNYQYHLCKPSHRNPVHKFSILNVKIIATNIPSNIIQSITAMQREHLCTVVDMTRLHNYK